MLSPYNVSEFAKKSDIEKILSRLDEMDKIDNIIKNYTSSNTTVGLIITTIRHRR